MSKKLKLVLLNVLTIVCVAMVGALVGSIFTPPLNLAQSKPIYAAQEGGSLTERAKANSITTYASSNIADGGQTGDNITATSGSDETYGDYAEITHTKNWANFKLNVNENPNGKYVVWYVYNPLSNGIKLSAGTASTIYNTPDQTWTLSTQGWTQISVKWTYAYGLNSWIFCMGDKAGDNTNITGLKITDAYVVDDVQTISDLVSEIQREEDASTEKLNLTERAKANSITTYASSNIADGGQTGDKITATSGSNETYGDYAEITHTASWANFKLNVNENPNGKYVVWYVYNPLSNGIKLSAGTASTIYNTPDQTWTLSTQGWTQISVKWTYAYGLNSWIFCMGDKAGDNTNITGLKITDAYVVDDVQTISDLLTGKGQFTEVTINVGNDLSLNFYASIGYIEGRSVSVRATMNDKTTEYVLNGKNSEYLSESQNVLKFTYTGIVPQNIRDTVNVALLFDGNEIDTTEYSVWQYCDNILSNSDDSRLQELVKTVMIYAGVMQDYVGDTSSARVDVDKNGDKVTSDITMDESKLTKEEVEPITETSADTTNYRFRGVGVRIDNCAAIYFRYYVASDKKAKLFINDKEYTDFAVQYKAETDGIIYTVYVKNITPLMYSTKYTAKLYSVETISDTEESQTLIQTVSYSIDNFIGKNCSSQNAKIKSVAEALYRYGYATEQFFKNTADVVVYDNSSAEAEIIEYHNAEAKSIILNEDIGKSNYVSFTYNSDSDDRPAVIGTVYYRAKSSSTGYSESFYLEKGTNNFSMYLDVYRKGATAEIIKDTNKIIEKIEFRNVDNSESSGYFSLATVGHSSKDLFAETDSDHIIKISDGSITVGMDFDLGGAVTYLSKAGINEYEIYRKNILTHYYDPVRYIGTDPTKSPDYVSSYGEKGYKLIKSSDVNLINIYDTGREIQQSYYAGVSDGITGNSFYNAATGKTETYPVELWKQTGNTASLQYNPVQAGGCENYQSQIIDYSVKRDSDGKIVSVYIKTRACEWGNPDTYENKLSWSYMETTYSIKNGMIYVDSRFIDWKGFEKINENQDGAIGQETPAIYLASSLGTFYADTNQYGEIKDSNLGDMTTDVKKLSSDSGHYAIKNDSTMKWHAWLNSEDFGVGIYMPTGGNATVYYFASKGTGEGNSGDGSNCYDNSYSYSSCAVVADFKEQTALEYTYVLCVDSLTNIQTKLNGITDVQNENLGNWTARG